MFKTGDNGESNSGPLAPKARIIPLDHCPCDSQFLSAITNHRSCNFGFRAKKNCPEKSFSNKKRIKAKMRTILGTEINKHKPMPKTHRNVQRLTRSTTYSQQVHRDSGSFQIAHVRCAFDEFEHMPRFGETGAWAMKILQFPIKFGVQIAITTYRIYYTKLHFFYNMNGSLLEVKFHNEVEPQNKWEPMVAPKRHKTVSNNRQFQWRSWRCSGRILYTL